VGDEGVFIMKMYGAIHISLRGDAAVVTRINVAQVTLLQIFLVSSFAFGNSVILPSQ